MSEIKSIFDVLRCLRSKHLIEFSLETNDDFDRRSNTISATP